MSQWQHVKRFDDGRCAVDVEGLPDGCYPPTPDPSSPCGLCGQNGYRTVHATDIAKGRRHPHQPTRCTCGHPIEPVP